MISLNSLTKKIFPPNHGLSCFKGGTCVIRISTFLYLIEKMKLQNLYLFSKIYSIDNGKDTNRTQNGTQEKQSSFLLSIHF